MAKQTQGRQKLQDLTSLKFYTDTDLGVVHMLCIQSAKEEVILESVQN